MTKSKREYLANANKKKSIPASSYLIAFEIELKTTYKTFV